MIFNIYYINFPKVYEIKMMFSNVISLGTEKQTEEKDGSDSEIKSRLGAKFLNFFGAEIQGNLKSTGSNTQKVLETFEIKTTKSIILNEIIDKSKPISSFDNLTEGELIRIDNVNLSLENEAELRIVKMFTSGAFKGVNVPGANGFDFTNLFNSMFKDYSYKMKGNFDSIEDELLVKIPITFENEFESSYSVDDLFIGKVTLLGLYKGKIKIDSLRNSFEFYKDLGEITNFQNNSNKPEDEIQNSQYDRDSSSFHFKSSKFSNKEYHYIDLLAIVQNISIPPTK
nr:hypothetical protein [uncultured Draconibacterium sp.]